MIDYNKNFYYELKNIDESIMREYQCNLNREEHEKKRIKLITEKDTIINSIIHSGSQQNQIDLLKYLQEINDITTLLELEDCSKNKIITESISSITEDYLQNVSIRYNSYSKTFITSDCYELSCVSEGTVFEDHKENRSLGCYNDSGRNYSLANAYFKFFNSTSYRKATKLARITLYDPTYISHKNSGNISNWTLSSGERKYLNKVMHSYLPDSSDTVWSALCNEFNKETNLNINFGNIIPDFTYIKGSYK